MKNFFDNPDFQAELREAVNEANEHLRSIKPLESEHEDNGMAGALFLFTESLDLPLFWVAILSHPDDSQMRYMVAADDFPGVGSSDVELSHSNPFSPMVFRCGVGFWAHSEDIEIDRFVGRLDSESIADARDRLEEMANGTVPATEHGRINDADDDYREWIRNLSEIAEQIERRIQSEPVVLKNVQFDKSWLKGVAQDTGTRSNSMALAADAVGKQPDVVPPDGLLLPSSLPGTLVLQREGDGFDLVYYPTSDTLPPNLVMVNGKSRLSGKWVQGPDGVWTWSDVLQAKMSHLSLVIGSEKFEVHVS